MSEDMPGYGLTCGGAPLQHIPANAQALIVACARCGHPVGQPCAETITPLSELKWAVRLDGDVIAIFESARMAHSWAGMDENEGATVEEITIAKGAP